MPKNDPFSGKAKPLSDAQKKKQKKQAAVDEGTKIVRPDGRIVSKKKSLSMRNNRQAQLTKMFYEKYKAEGGQTSKKASDFDSKKPLLKFGESATYIKHLSEEGKEELLDPDIPLNYEKWKKTHKKSGKTSAPKSAPKSASKPKSTPKLLPKVASKFAQIAKKRALSKARGR